LWWPKIEINFQLIKKFNFFRSKNYKWPIPSPP
jgi:hypothetical protein